MTFLTSQVILGGALMSIQNSAIIRDLLGRALDLSATERGQVFDELFESLGGHDELNALLTELERRGDLAWEPGMAEIERRLAAVEEPGRAEKWSTAEEVFDAASRRLAERRAGGVEITPTAPEPRLTGRTGDLAGAALALSPAERSALAHAILETIERCDEPPDDEAPR